LLAFARLAWSAGLAPGSPGRVPGVALVDDPGSWPRRGHRMPDPLGGRPPDRHRAARTL